MNDLTVGLDIGSTSIKAVLYDSAKDMVLDTQSETIDARLTTPDIYYEELPQVIFDAAIRVLKNICKTGEHNISAISFTGQMHGGLIVDEDLEPLTNFITWQDKRCDTKSKGGTLYIGELRNAVPFEVLFENGSGIHTGYLGATLYWLIQNQQLPKQAHNVLSIYEWIAARLAGSHAYTDVSSAAAWGLYSIKRKEWLEHALRAWQIPAVLLPKIFEAGEVIGNTDGAARSLGLPKGIAVICGAGDTQTSYIGSGCQPDEILLNFGTGSQSMWESRQFQIMEGTDIRYLPRGRYLMTVPTLAGGKAYDRLRQFYSEVISTFTGKEMNREDVLERMNQNAQLGELDAGITFVPEFAGSRFRAEQTRASITGLSNTNFRPQNVTQALLKGMVEEIAAPFLASADRNAYHCLVGSGNGMRKNSALQMAAERVFGLPLRLSRHPEEAATGAAMIAAGRFQC